MFSVGMIVPTWHYFADPFKLQPLNELYLATVIDDRLSQKGVQAHVIDLREVRNDEVELNLETARSYVRECDVYLYWIAKTADYVEISTIVKLLRNLYPKAKHFAGGTHVDNFPNECGEVFDAVVTGPGEESFISVIEDCRKNEIKKVYSSDWKNIQYNDYPFSNRSYLPESAIVNKTLFEKYGDIQATSAMFSRGCDFKCAYCVYNIPHKIQRRSNESIAAELTYLKGEYGIKGINLRDEICVPLSQKIAAPYLETLGQSGLVWRGQTRVGASRDMIKLAAEAGCVELAIGVESASQQVLDIINKGQKIDKAREFIQTCMSFGIKTRMCLILGLPGEPPDILDITKDLINDVGPDYVNVSGFCPVPGSIIFEDQKKYGIKYIDNDWRKHAHLMFRFSGDEDFGLPFEYESEGPWGSALSRSEITDNIKELQCYLQQNAMSY